MKMLHATWLLKTMMEKGPISLKDINKLWIQDKLTEGNSLSRSTFIRYKNMIEEFYELNIDCDKHYRYYVSNPKTLSAERVEGWIYARMSDDLILMDADDIRERIMLEPTPSARPFLKSIIASMKKNRVIEIEYKRYESDEPHTSRVKPYYLKLYHQKWYMVAMTRHNTLRGYCLDRLINMSETDETFTMSKKNTAARYFKYSYGVFVDENMEPCKVVLRAYGNEPDYLRDLPLHPSQKEVGAGDGFVDFEYKLRPSLDLMGKILERADRLEIISPEDFRKQLLRKAREIVKLYK